MKCTSKLVFFTLLIFAARVSGQTNVSGLVAANTTWSLAGSPFIVTGNVLVLSGTTLTIEPGVEVRFNAGLILQVSGSLIANGTPSSHITFTANTLTPSKGFWNYIYLTGPNAGLYINDAAISSFFDYCDVKYGGSGGKGSIRAENATARITNCAIQESSSQGLTFKNSPTTVQYCFINNNS